MSGRSAEVDRYIERAPAHARPVLLELRDLVHSVCPTTEEAIKWGMPTFNHRGIFASMAGFKAHSTFRFWKAALLGGEGNAEIAALARIAAPADLPPRPALAELVRQAVALNEDGVASPRSNVSERRPEADVPADMMAALRGDPRALERFEAFSPSRRREYVEWITEAKRDATRTRRLAQAIEWIAEGKPRNWKYM